MLERSFGHFWKAYVSDSSRRSPKLQIMLVACPRNQFPHSTLSLNRRHPFAVSIYGLSNERFQVLAMTYTVSCDRFQDWKLAAG